jgi:hypothetical protein
VSAALPVLTTSRQACASRCQREHHYSYRLGYRPAREADALRFGSLLHAALEAWWLAAKAGADDETRLASALAAMAGEADPFDRARAEAMVFGYDARWSSDLALYEVLAVEAQFETDLVNPETGAPSRTWRLGGKLDLVVRERATGQVQIWDHKTASVDIRPGSDFYKRLRIDRQISTYYAGAAALGFDAQAWQHDVLAKPGQRPSAVPLLDEDGTKIVVDASGARVRTKDGKKWRESASTADGYVLQTRPETPAEYQARVLAAIAEDPNGYFQRATVVRLEAELADAAFDAWQVAKQLREAELVGRFPRNPDACVRYGSTCSFFEVCTGAASLDDPSLFRRIENTNPELAPAAGRAA